MDRRPVTADARFTAAAPGRTGNHPRPTCRGSAASARSQPVLRFFQHHRAAGDLSAAFLELREFADWRPIGGGLWPRGLAHPGCRATRAGAAVDGSPAAGARRAPRVLETMCASADAAKTPKSPKTSHTTADDNRAAIALSVVQFPVIQVAASASIATRSSSTRSTGALTPASTGSSSAPTAQARLRS